MLHLAGIYTMSAINAVFADTKKHPQAKYPSEPVQIFELTEEEKEAAQERELQKFIAWTAGVHTESKEDANNANRRLEHGG